MGVFFLLLDTFLQADQAHVKDKFGTISPHLYGSVRLFASVWGFLCGTVPQRFAWWWRESCREQESREESKVPYCCCRMLNFISILIRPQFSSITSFFFKNANDGKLLPYYQLKRMRQYVWDQEIISGENFLSPVQRCGVNWQNCTFSLLLFGYRLY